MFTERDALAYRLQRLEEKERALVKERVEIYDRLRELDEREAFKITKSEVEIPAETVELPENHIHNTMYDPIKEEIVEKPAVVEEPETIEEPEAVEEPEVTQEPTKATEMPKKERSTPIKTISRNEATDAILAILKDADTPLTVRQLRALILKEYKAEVKGLSATMNYLSRKTEKVKNPERGLYELNRFYKESEEENEQKDTE